MSDHQSGIETKAGRALVNKIWQGHPYRNDAFYHYALELIEGLRGEADRIERDADRIAKDLIRDARENRFTWEQIGTWFGTSRQGAFNRFGRSVDPVGLPLGGDGRDDAC